MKGSLTVKFSSSIAKTSSRPASHRLLRRGHELWRIAGPLEPHLHPAADNFDSFSILLHSLASLSNHKGRNLDSKRFIPCMALHWAHEPWILFPVFPATILLINSKSADLGTSCYSQPTELARLRRSCLGRRLRLGRSYAWRQSGGVGQGRRSGDSGVLVNDSSNVIDRDLSKPWRPRRDLEKLSATLHFNWHGVVERRPAFV